MSGRYIDSPILLEEIASLPLELRTALGLTAAVSTTEVIDTLMRLAERVSFFRYAAVGFLDPDVDLTYPPQRPPFGVILYAESPAGRTMPGDPTSEDRWEVRLPDDLGVLPVVVRRGTSAVQGSTGPAGPARPAVAGQFAC